MELKSALKKESIKDPNKQYCKKPEVRIDEGQLIQKSLTKQPQSLSNIEDSSQRSGFTSPQKSFNMLQSSQTVEKTIDNILNNNDTQTFVNTDYQQILNLSKDEIRKKRQQIKRITMSINNYDKNQCITQMTQENEKQQNNKEQNFQIEVLDRQFCLYFKMAQLELEENNLQKTADFLEKAIQVCIKQNPDNPIVYNAQIIYSVLGLIYYIQKDYDEAITNYRQYYNYADLEERQKILYKIAKCHVKLGYLDEALEYYEQAIQLDMKNYKNHMKLGQFYVIHMKNPKKGVEFLTRASSLYNKNPKLILYLADANLSINMDSNWEAAIEYYEYLINQYKDKEKYALQKNDIWQCYLGLAKAHEKLEDFDKAIENIQTSVETIENLTVKENLKFYKGQLQKNNNQLNEAMSTYQDILQNNKNHVPSLIEYSNFLAQQSQFDKSKRLLKIALKLEPENMIANFRIGQIFHFIDKNYNKAKKYYQKMIEIEPNYYVSYYQMALIYHEIDDVEEASEYLIKTLEREPNFLDAWKYIGQIFLELQKYNQSLQFYQKALKLDPNNRDLKKIIADIQFYQEDYDKAIPIYKEQIKDNQENDQEEKNLELYLLIGNYYFNLQQIEEALKYYKKGLEIDKNQSDFLYNIGNVYSVQEEFDQAITYFKRSYQISGNIAALYNQANCLYIQGAYDPAFHLYNQVIKNKDKIVQLDWINQICNFMLRHNFLDKAQEILEDIINNNTPNLQTYLIYSKILNRQNKKQEALYNIQRAWVIDPQSQELKSYIQTLSESDQCKLREGQKRTKKQPTIIKSIDPELLSQLSQSQN